ncbi:MAG: ROK family protein [Pyrinomonadaceae bacterium]
MAENIKTMAERVGVEISAASINAVVLGEDGGIAKSHSVVLTADSPMVEQLVALVDTLKKEIGGINRIGLAVPGLIDRASGRVAFSTNMPENASVDLINEIKYTTSLDVVIENDANAAAYGEFLLGAGRGVRNMFYATLGDGVGGAFIFNSEMWRGAAGYAGEFGHVTINSEGMKLEEVASAANIIRRTRARFHQDSTSSLNNLPEESITLAAIIAAAESDDDFAQMMLERTGSYVGAAIASVINLLNIEKIVVGGAIMQAKGVVLNAIIERARELAFAPAFEATSIVEGELGLNAAAAGAACLSGEVSD